ncbi:acyl-[ACP]--phospholipid O-acyltransferase [Dongia sp.]|uniref:acyl-[ACP]--phospholipid O-acyltransferase n=1 Tax=Dongia sp. TaxID=1977262 RepID=UPI0035B158FB
MNDRSYRRLILDPGFGWMLVTQFLGALNDNIYRFVVSFFAIALAAQQEDGLDAATYLSAIAAMFVLPYLLFSGYAGQLADRYPKRSVLIVTKSLEILAMGLGFVAFVLGNLNLMMAVMFLMALQSTFFSPAKYACLPELLPDHDLSRGNALIEMSTFLAIILGTWAGGQLFESMGNQPVMLGAIVLAIAVIGTLASFGIGRTPHPVVKAPFQLNPLAGIDKGMAELFGNRRLFLTVLGISWFWFLGALLQISIPLYGTQVLGLGEGATGTLWAAVAIGIGIGSMAAGRLSGHKVELGLVPIGSVGMGLCAMFLVTADTTGGAIFCFGLLGFFGGFFVVPLNAMLQQKSEAGSRGRIIAANNVLNFIAILLAAVANYVFGSVLAFRPDEVIFAGGILSFLVTGYIFFLLPDFFLRFVLWSLTHSIYRIRIVGAENVPLNGPALLVCNHLSFVDGLLVGACVQRFVRFMVYAPFFQIPGLGGFLKRMHAIPTGGGKVAEPIRRARAELAGGHVVCIFAEGAITRTGNMLPFKRGFERISDGIEAPVIPVHLDQVWGSIFSFKDGKFFWKWPSRFFYPVTITFGKPLPSDTKAFVVRQKLLEMSGDSFRHRRKEDDLVAIRFIKTAKANWFRFALADSLGREMTFGETLTGARILSDWFKRERPGEQMVGVLLPGSVGAALVNMGLMLAGKVPVNLNFTIGAEAMESAIRQCGIKTIVTAKPFLAKAKLEERPGMIYAEDLLGGIGKATRLLMYVKTLLTPTGMLTLLAGPRGQKIDDLCTVMFSSGSTGEPKGVMLSQHNVVSNLEALAQILWAQKSDRIIGVLPFFHSFGFTGTLCLPLVVGLGAVYHPNPLDGKTIGGLVKKYRATIMISTPTFCQAYYRICPAEDFASLRYVVVGAEKLRPDFAAQFKEKYGLDMLEGYGTTEMGPVVAVNVPNYGNGIDRQVGHKPGTVGHPIPGVAARIVDPDSYEERAPGEEGLLLLKSPARMLGYLNNPEKTADVLRDGWYVTGDIAVLDDDGFIRITDRLSRFSKIGGEMVPHLKVEEALLRIPGISGANVTSIPDAAKGERLVGFYVAEEPLEPALVWRQLNESEMPKIWIPKAADLYRIEELPVLGTGKTDLKRLKAMALTAASAAQ